MYNIAIFLRGKECELRLVKSGIIFMGLMTVFGLTLGCQRISMKRDRPGETTEIEAGFTDSRRLERHGRMLSEKQMKKMIEESFAIWNGADLDLVQ